MIDRDAIRAIRERLLAESRLGAEDILALEAEVALACGPVTPSPQHGHGEAIKCLLCGGYGVRGGYKRGEDDDKPVEHRPGCALAAIRAARGGGA